jgi:hypothetical protein
MNRFHLAVGLSLFVLVIGQVSLAQKPSTTKQPKAPAVDRGHDFVIGEPVIYDNLAVFPVSASAARNDDRFITLDEGLKAGTVEVFEKGATPVGPQNRPAARDAANDSFENPFGAPPPQSRAGNQQARTSGQRAANDVNSLMVVNKSNKPLYLMPGEIIIGGSQDRTIAKELIIAPDKKPVAIDVFCVEHGRWGSRDRDEYAGYLAEARSGAGQDSSVTIQSPEGATLDEVVNKANSGTFIGSVGSLNKQSRLTVQKGAGQHKVWDEVAKENSKAGVRSTSGAFTGNYGERSAVKRLEPYIKNLQSPITKTQNVVGVIVAVNGKVESMDVFESSPLFKKLWPKLLKSYALDAANAVTGKQVKRTASRTDAVAFLKNVAEAKSKKTETSGSLAVSHHETDQVLLFSAHEARGRSQAKPSAGLGGHGGGLGGAIHSSAYGK